MIEQIFKQSLISIEDDSTETEGQSSQPKNENNDNTEGKKTDESEGKHITHNSDDNDNTKTNDTNKDLTHSANERSDTNNQDDHRQQNHDRNRVTYEKHVSYSDIQLKIEQHVDRQHNVNTTLTTTTTSPTTPTTTSTPTTTPTTPKTPKTPIQLPTVKEAPQQTIQQLKEEAATWVAIDTQNRVLDVKRTLFNLGKLGIFGFFSIIMNGIP